MSTYEESDKFHHCIDELIKINLAFREKARPHFEKISPQLWLRDFCTVIVDIGRQTGKTEYICRRATKDDLVITYSMVSANKFPDGRIFEVVSAESADFRKTLLANKYKRIFIDEAGLVFRLMSFNDILRHYSDKKLVVDLENTTFILLGFIGLPW